MAIIFSVYGAGRKEFKSIWEILEDIWSVTCGITIIVVPALSQRLACLGAKTMAEILFTVTAFTCWEEKETFYFRGR